MINIKKEMDGAINKLSDENLERIEKMGFSTDGFALYLCDRLDDLNASDWIYMEAISDKKSVLDDYVNELGYYQVIESKFENVNNNKYNIYYDFNIKLDYELERIHDYDGVIELISIEKIRFAGLEESKNYSLEVIGDIYRKGDFEKWEIYDSINELIQENGVKKSTDDLINNYEIFDGYLRNDILSIIEKLKNLSSELGRYFNFIEESKFDAEEALDELEGLDEIHNLERAENYNSLAELYDEAKSRGLIL